MRFLRTQARTDTHISTFTLPLDFDPPPSLCISYELSEKTQWIEWQRSKARPSNRPGWRGDGWLCVYECVCAYICVCVCVFDSHPVQSGLCMHVNMNMFVHRVLCFYSLEAFSPYFTTWNDHIRMHAHIVHESGLWSVVGEVKWQVFNQCWPPHAMELICWTRLNLPLTLHLIHPLTGCRCHTQVTASRDSLTNNMWEVEGERSFCVGQLPRDLVSLYIRVHILTTN